MTTIGAKKLNFELPGHAQGVLDLNAEVAHRSFQFGMAE
jgi:hypothetical protein